MNEELKLRHLATITHESAVEMYEKLCAACEQREGGMTDPDQMLVADIARAEQIKQQLLDDIAKRGIGQERSNGQNTGRKTAAWRRCAPTPNNSANTYPNYG